MRSEIEQALKRMIVMIQMWINLISSSSRSTAVIAEAMEATNLLNSFSLLQLKYSSVTPVWRNRPLEQIARDLYSKGRLSQTSVTHACINNFIAQFVYY